MSVLNIVAHNLPAMYTDRQLGIVTGEKAKSSEKLASGYRINRAADDAAGLSISEKLRKRIRGLNQGSANLQDGVSLCQTADGALMEVEDMIHRMNELAIKAANGTNSQSDRQDINAEISQLKDEMSRVFNTTKFNEIYIFKAPYVPDVMGKPDDFELFNGPDGVNPAGVLINNKRYTWDELEAPPVATGGDWVKEITDPDVPEELIRLRIKSGESREEMHRVYVMTADDNGIMINNLYAGTWGDTIKQDGTTFSFSYRGMDVSIEAESTERSDVIDKLRKDPITEISWDAIPFVGDGNSAVGSSQHEMVLYVTDSNKNDIDSWEYRIIADEEGVGLVQTVGDDGLDHTKTKWSDFTNRYSGDPFPISDWGTENEGNNPVTLDSSASYEYQDGARAPYLYLNGLSFSFRFSENEVSKSQAINGLTQDLSGARVRSPISSVTSDGSGVTVGSNNVTDFYFQRDKLLRNFGSDGSPTPMTLTVERTMVHEGTITDHEWRRKLSEAYAKKIDNYVDTKTTTYNKTGETFYDVDGVTPIAMPADAHYDDSIPTGSSVTIGRGTVNPSGYVLNTGLAYDWSETVDSVLSDNSENKTVRREMKDGEGTLIGYVDIDYTERVENKRSTTSRYETSGSSIKNYVSDGHGGYTEPDGNTAYVMDASAGDKDVNGNAYRTAGSSESGQRYVQNGSAYVAIKNYNLEHYTYEGKNSAGDAVMYKTAGNPNFLVTDTTASSITITNSDGSTTTYKTENNSEVLNTRISNASYNNGNTYINLSYDASGAGSKTNTLTITPNGPATRTFTKNPQVAGRSTDTDLLVRVNPPEKKLELQAADVNLKAEREILEWTPLSNSILGLSNANTKTVSAARATISSIEGALQILNFDRSVFGAYQNRLEHAIKINDNTSENTQSAESVIRDTDMAQEMVKYSKQNILQQAGQSILAQADQSNQGVLSLLRG